MASSPTSAAMTYTSKCVLAGEHTNAINCIAFSPDGNLIASGGSDFKIVIWCLSSGTARHRIMTRSAVMSLIWPRNISRLIVGTEDGTLMTVDLSEVRSQCICQCSKTKTYVLRMPSLSVAFMLMISLSNASLQMRVRRQCTSSHPLHQRRCWFGLGTVMVRLDCD